MQSSARAMINLHDKKFKTLANSDNGEVSEDTIFHYRQKGKVIWATYEGGEVLFGTLSGSIDDNKLQFSYQHQNQESVFMTGHCKTVIKIRNGKILLHETWQWTSGDQSKGTSTLIEV